MPQKESGRDGGLGRCRPSQRSRVLFLKATVGLNKFHAETNSRNTRDYGDRHNKSRLEWSYCESELAYHEAAAREDAPCLTSIFVSRIPAYISPIHLTLGFSGQLHIL